MGAIAAIHEDHTPNFVTRENIQRKIVVLEVEPGLVFDRGGVRVTVFPVDHGTIKPAVGYRVDYSGRSVIISGDTKKTDSLIRAPKGVDVLIHEVWVSNPNPPDPERERIATEAHTEPEAAGEVFSQTRPRLAVYSHFAPRHDDLDEIVTRTRKTYGGPLEMGEDLMRIEIGEEVKVVRARSH